MTLKKEMEDILYPERKELTPLRAPIGEKDRNSNESSLGIISSSTGETSSTDSKPIIDFSYIDWSYLSDNSSFQRGIMEFIKKIVPGLENIEVRGSKEVMAKSFSQEKRNYINVMSEFKSKLEKIKNE